MQPARSRQQTHLRCRPWFKHASISALLGDSESKTPCSWQHPMRSSQPASGGPPRLVPRTFRAALAGPVTTGPGARAADMPEPGILHTVHAVIHPCATRVDPGKKFSGCRAHACSRRTHAVKCAQMPSNLYLRPLPVPAPGCMRRPSGRAGIAGGGGGMLFGGRDGTAA